MVVSGRAITCRVKLLTGPCSGPMCGWALGLARYARNDTKLYTGCSLAFLWLFVNTRSRSRVGTSFGLVRAIDGPDVSMGLGSGLL